MAMGSTVIGSMAMGLTVIDSAIMAGGGNGLNRTECDVGLDGDGSGRRRTTAAADDGGVAAVDGQLP